MAVARIHPAVVEASEAGRGLVALETAVLTHGLPRTPMPEPACCASLLADTPRRWDPAQPANLELARAMATATRAAGSVPVTIGVLRGEVVVGLDDGELAELGADPRATKISGRDLAAAHALGESGGTTVAGTLAAVTIANRELPNPIRVFATGGIGGVHRGWTTRPDISNDLAALAATPVCVVSAGAKSILDLAATLEALDTLGIPVLGLETHWFPRFLSPGTPPLAVQRRISTLAEAARICLVHWTGLGSPGGVLLANPPPVAFALDVDSVEAIIHAGLADAAAKGVASAEVTPFLLAYLAKATDGRSVGANIAALLHNARVAAELAQRMAAG